MRVADRPATAARHTYTCHAALFRFATPPLRSVRVTAAWRAWTVVMTPSPIPALDLRIRHMRLLFVPALALLFAGCAHRASEVRPVTPIAVPDAFRASATTTAVVPHWLTTFADPTLESLVREAWAANPDLRATAARLAQSEARATQAGATRLPSVSAEFGAARTRSNPDLGAGAQTRYSTEYNAGLGVAWEIDVWGRLAAGSRAEGAEAIAARTDLEAAHRALAAQVARAWYRLAHDRLRLTLIEDFRRSSAITEKLLSQRFADGKSPAVDVRAARADLARAEVDVRDRQRVMAESSRALETLLGRYPAAELAAAEDLPPPPPSLPAGLPSDLLLRRPDLRAAATRLIAADERLAGAEADLLPRLSLTASGGTRSDALRNLTDPDFLVWTLIGNLTQPLFEGGRRLAVVDEREARVRELAATWAAAAITALREVEDALAVSDAQRDTLPQMQTSADESQAVVRLLQERYAAGLGDGLTLLREQRTALSRRIDLLNLRLEQLLTRIDLHQALGGDVTADQRTAEERVIERDRTSPAAGVTNNERKP